MSGRVMLRSAAFALAAALALLCIANVALLYLPVVANSRGEMSPAKVDVQEARKQRALEKKQKIQEEYNLIVKMLPPGKPFGSNETIDELVRPSKELGNRDRKSIYSARNALVESVCRDNGLDDFEGFWRKLRKRSRSRADRDQLDRKPGLEGDFEYVEMEKPRPELRWRNAYPVEIDKCVITDKDRKLTYCWTHKVASTSWNKIFLDFAGKEEYDPAHMYMAAVELKPERKDLVEVLSEKYFKFTFARHPFERIVSAYVEKFELAYTYNWVYSTYTPLIFAANNITKISRRPTFRQFAVYLITSSPDEYNDHWVPQWMHCRLCQVRYDVIGYLETGAEDGDYILSEAGVANVNLPWHNKSSKKHGKKRKHDSPLGYFSELDLNLVEGLFAKYRIDFEIFNYSAKEYFALFDRAEDDPPGRNV